MTHTLPASPVVGRRPGLRRMLVGNVAARLVALVALALATVLVARVGGPALVGAFTLLRVLPGLAGVLVSAGLPGAAPYFLAGSGRADPRVRAALGLLTVAGATAAAAGWLALTPVLHQVFFRQWDPGLTVAAALAVFTQLFVSVGKALLQGADDMRGANVAIGAEEVAFLPAYLAVLPFGPGLGPLLAGLVLADVVVAAGIAVRLARRGFFSRWSRPGLPLLRQITAYGMRGQLGGMLSLLNLRLDVAILGALAGPAVLGVYAVASKFAELLRLPGLAVTYVLYPAFAAQDAAAAAARTRALFRRAGVLTLLAAVPLALAAGPLLPLLYGRAFHGAIVPAWILLAGLVGEGIAGLVTAYLYGVGRPGVNSLAMGAGVLVTVVLDLLLIPRHGAVGAAVASAVAYLTTTATLVFAFHQLASRRRTVRAPVVALVVVLLVSPPMAFLAGRHSASAEPVAAATSSAARPAPPSRSRSRGPFLAPVAPYAAAVDAAHRRGLRVWIEADLRKRWLAGPASFAEGVDRVAQLSRRPGVVGVKVVDEIGYQDGLDSPAKVGAFLHATALALRKAAPGRAILVDMVVPELGCMPDLQPPIRWATICSVRARGAYPQLALPAVDGYVASGDVDVIDLSSSILPAKTYAGWGTDEATAQRQAWREVRRRGWAGHVRL
ncbi:MAG TPA: polysaccharide biosynthesis C-terminal domain-containing protein, partial [Mycobacteriales bacterium]|nr:polysaccharide biosynthesis C-terminal domain-containing protein [Mycobacteriales bacterium]